ncbi:MAG: C10 family peptidase [Bacteroidaceae bacterium]|nr:C10 family peptidase [Bacteroidaceae bacterium]
MKNRYVTFKTFVFAILATVLCPPTQAFAKVVTESQAARIAQRLMSVPGKRLVKKRVTDGSTGSSDLPYYIFTGNDGRGFAIIAADDVARPILGYSSDAELTADGELPVPMQQWLTDISKQIQKAQESGARQSAAVAEQWESYSTGNTVVQLETAKWGQSAPFFNACPSDQDMKCLAGCVPVAYSILMKYYRYPQAGKGETLQYVTNKLKLDVPSRSLEHEYDWDDMPMQYISGEYTSAQADKVATLLADLGAAIQVEYTTDNTTGFPGRGTLLNNFGYHPGITRLKSMYTAEEWDELLQKELDMNRPIIYRAENTDGGGHAFILDGYTDGGYYSVNWGWAGNYNGLYALDAMTAGKNDYSSNQSAHLNTVPMPANTAEPMVEMDGQDYPTLTAAIDNALPDGTPVTINLYTDMQAESFRIQNGKVITLNIGDHNIDLQYGIYNYGNLNVKGTEKSHVVSHGNAGVIENSGTLSVTGGTYKNISTTYGETDYRRCVWSAEGSETVIADVNCESNGQTVCTNGKMTINSGTFISRGNSSVLSNYNTNSDLTVNGGTFLNTCEQIRGTDYRRCLWTKQKSKTTIGQATFVNDFGGQALCFNGNATINGADISNVNGRYGCAAFSKAKVDIEDCRLSSPLLFYTESGSQIDCKGGLYSREVTSAYLADGCECVPNTQTETSTKYPYMVQEIGTGIEAAQTDKDEREAGIYSTQGILLPRLQKGVNVIRRSDGTTRKLLKNN